VATGISPKLPLSLDMNDGHYEMTKTVKENVAQNLKNLILTIPGEKIMDTSFGVGLASFLFQQNTEEIHGEIYERINQQVAMYMPFVAINEVYFSNETSEMGLGMMTPNEVSTDMHSLSIRVEFTIQPLDVQEILDITVGIN